MFFSDIPIACNEKWITINMSLIAMFLQVSNLHLFATWDISSHPWTICFLGHLLVAELTRTMCVLSHKHETGFLLLFGYCSVVCFQDPLPLPVHVGKQLFQMHHRRPHPVFVLEAEVLDPGFKNKKKGQSRNSGSSCNEAGHFLRNEAPCEASNAILYNSFTSYNSMLEWDMSQAGVMNDFASLVHSLKSVKQDGVSFAEQRPLW